MIGFDLDVAVADFVFGHGVGLRAGVGAADEDDGDEGVRGVDFFGLDGDDGVGRGEVDELMAVDMVAFDGDEGFAGEGGFDDDGDVFAGFEGGFFWLQGDERTVVPCPGEGVAAEGVESDAAEDGFAVGVGGGGGEEVGACGGGGEVGEGGGCLLVGAIEGDGGLVFLDEDALIFGSDCAAGGFDAHGVPLLAFDGDLDGDGFGVGFAFGGDGD